MFNTTSITEHYSAYIYGRVRGREEGRKVLKRYRDAKKKSSFNGIYPVQ